MVEPISLKRVELSEILHLAPIKPGFIPAAEQGEPFEPGLRYADRLRRVLDAFNAREEQGFPSVIRVFRGIQVSSWALIDGDTRLLLSVTFDGEWHDYLRSLVYEVPGFLHLIWGNCVGWKRVQEQPEHLFEFIQAHQVQTRFFYAHHPDLNVRDVEWLKQLRRAVDAPENAVTTREKLYAAVERSLPPLSQAERLAGALAGYASAPGAQLPEGKDAVGIAQQAFRKILKPLYPRADYALAYREAFGAPDPELEPAAPRLRPRLGEDAADDAQGNVVRPFEHAYCARMFFVHFPAQARIVDGSGRSPAQRWLAQLGGQLDSTCVGFTPEGLRALGVAEAELADLPDAFRQGMRARAQRLGDPDTSRLPALPEGSQPGKHGELHALVVAYHDQPPDSDHPAAVALVEQLSRLGQHVRARGCGPLPAGDLRAALTAALDARGRALAEDAERHDVWLLGQQDLHLPLIDRKPIEYFGFRDGVSQPIALDAHGEPVDPQSLRQVLHAGPSPLLRNGSFLVVRQLAQDTQAFWKSMEALRGRLGLARAEEAAELAMGRRMNGVPLGGGREEDRAFAPGDDGARCPFHSHVRRVNPRLEQEPELNPTLVRRGMSWATADAHGLMFMAFNADLASQYEFIQRNWVQSGSHVAQTSSERDPIAGVMGASAPQRPAKPSAGTSFEVGEQQAHVDLPVFVSLRWGHYFFVPGRKALESLAQGGFTGASGALRAGESRGTSLAAQLAAAANMEEAKKLVRKWLDDPRAATEFWHEVEAGRITRLDGWVFVAAPEQVRAIMSDESGRYSVSEYLARMKTSSGKFFLGMDKSDGYDAEQRAIAIIPRAPEAVVDVEASAYRAASHFIALMYRQTALKALSGVQRTVELNLPALIAMVLSEVWSDTLGLGGPSRFALLAWGKDLTRSLFRVAADEADEAKAARAGHEFRQYVDARLAKIDDQAFADLLTGKSACPRAAQRIADSGDEDAAADARLRNAAHTLCKALDAQSPTDDVVARNLLNVVTGSLGATTRLFLDGLEAFRAQHAGPAGELLLPAGSSLAHAAPLADDAPYERVLMDSLAKARRGGPDSLYRVFTAREEQPPELAELEGRLDLKPGDVTVVWLGGMLGPARAQHDYAFGAGFRRCPGMDMGKAILNGVLLALFQQPGLRMRPAEVPSATFAFEPRPAAP